MEKKIFVLGMFIFCVVFLYGCSMVPNDDEIINGSINESEIIDPELGMSDDVVDVNGVEYIENIDESENNIDVDENGGENVDVEFEVID